MTEGTTSFREQPFLRHAADFSADTWGEALSAADEGYSHQIVAPRLLAQHVHPTWAERCYLSVRLAPGLMLNAGRVVYPYAGERRAFVGVATADAQHVVYEAEPCGPRDDPDDPRVGPVAIEVVEPLRELRVRVDDSPLRVDMSVTMRGPVVPSSRNLIEVDGELVTDYMNFYQSGWWAGTISVGGAEHRIEPVAGMRDRGWGMRKHEGSPRRGFVLFAALEFAERTIWTLLYEKASGERVFTDGWLVDRDGVVDTVTAVDHDLRLEGGDVEGGSLLLGFASGARRRLDFEVDARIHLGPGGYSPRPDWPPRGYARYDLTDPVVVEQVRGQTDNGCTCALDGEPGHGFVETGIGAHARYGPGGD